MRAIRQGLSDAGFVEGRTLTIEYRWAESAGDSGGARPGRTSELVADLVRERPLRCFDPDQTVLGAYKRINGGLISIKSAKRSSAYRVTEVVEFLHMRTIPAGLLALIVVTSPGLGQQAGSPDDVQEGRRLAILICANCHVAASSQPFEPILRPPAPSFESIAKRKGVDMAWVQTFVATTHRGVDHPNGMPNPELLDSQTRQVAAYLMSLRKNP